MTARAPKKSPDDVVQVVVILRSGEAFIIDKKPLQTLMDVARKHAVPEAAKISAEAVRDARYQQACAVGVMKLLSELFSGQPVKPVKGAGA